MTQPPTLRCALTRHRTIHSTGPRNRALVRQWRLVTLLRARYGVTLDELAAQLGVTTRTIRRDLLALEEVHVPIVVGRFEDRIPRYRLMKDTACPLCGVAPTARMSA